MKQIPLKPRIKSTGKNWPTDSKDGLGVNDAEFASGHEDDALFGDLFSEDSRQIVISDGHEQPCSANDSVSDSSNIPLQGAVEVLESIFSETIRNI